MGDFKQDLYKELQVDVPFTEQRKQRILSARPQKKRSRWPVPVVSATVLAVLLLFVLIRPTEAPYTVASMPTDYKELLQLLQENEVRIPFVKAIEDQHVVFADQTYANSPKLMYFSHFPLVVEQTDIQIGDYVILEELGYLNMVQIVAMDGDQVDTKNQQVFVNGAALALPGMMALELDITEQSSEVAKQLSRYVAYPSAYPFNPFPTRSFQVGQGEVAVKLGDEIVAKSLKNIEGKVVAIQQVKSTLVLTQEEQAYYQALKEQGLAALKDAEPMTVAKLHVQTMLEQEFELNYLLQSNNENYHQRTKEQLIEILTVDGITKEQFQQIIASIYNGVEKGIVSEDVTGEMQIRFKSQGESSLVMKLRPNKDGIWQVSETIGE